MFTEYLKDMEYKDPSAEAMAKGLWWEMDDGVYVIRYLFYRGHYYVVRCTYYGEETPLPR